jgi:PiT family inorganic phosphate transporter
MTLPGRAGPVLDAPEKSGRIFAVIFALVLLVGVVYAAMHLNSDLQVVHTNSALPFVLLGIALTIALGFEFVNGFHDTANAVATVIYTHSMPANLAVIWSGAFNFLGVLTSTGAVAFAVVSLLPVELILQVGNSAGFAMVFALLIAAIIWNLGTWAFGIPNSSSHTLIGSIIGVGLANQLMQGADGTSGVDWGQAAGVIRSLLFSPVIGFLLSGLLLLLLKAVVKMPALYKAPEGNKPPPLPIRALLVLTCTGVSFAHGSNDGQKGMGLIMLILIGTVPTAYALNSTMRPEAAVSFHAVTQQIDATLGRLSADAPAPADPRNEVMVTVERRTLQPATLPALRSLIGTIDRQVVNHATLAEIPQGDMTNIRNEMYLADEGLRFLQKTPPEGMTDADKAIVKSYRGLIGDATKFIPSWVKVAVALALGLGTMVGWKRIVVTVGEKIGKDHLTYAQGASAELVAMATIGAADMYGLPVSTTHVLTSGVAGTMAANGSGLQWATVRSLAMAWVLTLPASILIAGVLYAVFRSIF